MPLIMGAAILDYRIGIIEISDPKFRHEAAFLVTQKCHELRKSQFQGIV